MKKKSVLALLMFIFAVGSAVATDLFSDPMGYTRKIDVPAQGIENCKSRRTCAEGLNPCTVVIDHDGNPVTAPVTVNLYDGLTTPSAVCGSQLFEQ